jgi:hypothetical protein
MENIFNKKINLLEELKLSRKEFVSSEEILLSEVKEILKNELDKEKSIIQRLKHDNKNNKELYGFNIDALEKDRIYTIAEIKSICEKYRLRFLNSNMFKSEFPKEAIDNIKETEEKLGVKFEDYKVIAPESLFRLKDSLEDPILLANMGNGRYYFIHKWGNDLSASRAIKYYPIRNLSTLTISVFSLAVFLTVVIPTNWIVKGTFMLEYEYLYRVMFFVSCFVWISAILIYYGFVANKNLSENEWNNKYFN